MSTVARLHGACDVRVARERDVRPGAGEATVEIRAVGICGSDIHWYRQGRIGDAELHAPLVLGHEAMGVIASGRRAGQRVVIDPAVPCLTCEPCRRGLRHLCLSVRFAGHAGTDGAMRERMVWPEAQLVAIPDSVSDAAGAMVEPLAVALHAADLGRLRPGGTVAVIGCGPIGLLIIMVARLFGARTIVASDVLPHRAAAGRLAGADVAGEATADATQRLLDSLGGGADVAFEVAGTDAALDAAIRLARPAGTVVVVGIPDEDRFAFNASVARRKGLDLRLARRTNVPYDRPIGLVQNGLVDVEALVTHTFSLSDASDAIAVADARAGSKVLVEPQARSSRRA